MSAPAKSPEKQKQDINPTFMVHINNGHDEALCGAPVRGILFPIGELDCVVCAELWATMHS
jgi:hypothetical protein